MASQIVTPFDVTGTASMATRRSSTAARPGPAGRRLVQRPTVAHELGWMVVSVLTGLAAAAAAAGWMIDSIHLF